MNLLFTLSYNKDIGSGHLYRVKNIYFYSNILNKSIAVQCKSDDRKFITKVLGESNFVFFSDFNNSDFRKFILEKEISIIVTDLILQDINKIALLKKEFNFKLISILSYEKEVGQIKNSDCLIHPSPIKLEKKSEVKIYSGPEVLFLNKEIISMKYSFRSEVKNIIIFFGGTDPENIMGKIYRCVKNKKLENYNFILISNTYYPSTRNIKSIKPGSDYFKILKNSDLAIINGGTTRYEMSYLGIPTIAISIHKEQYKISQKTSEINGMINLGVYKDLKQKEITESIQEKSSDLAWRLSFNKLSTQYFETSKNAYSNFNQILANEKNKCI